MTPDTREARSNHLRKHACTCKQRSRTLAAIAWWPAASSAVPRPHRVEATATREQVVQLEERQLDNDVTCSMSASLPKQTAIPSFFSTSSLSCWYSRSAFCARMRLYQLQSRQNASLSTCSSPMATSTPAFEIDPKYSAIIPELSIEHSITSIPKGKETN
jgi:hypothetical protein